jgi:hypothetical protein
VESLPSKIRILKNKRKKKKKERKRKRKRKEQGLKRKRGETSYEEAPCFKRRTEKDEIYKLPGEILLNERGSHFPIVQNLMCTHTSFAFALPSIP